MFPRIPFLVMTKKELLNISDWLRVNKLSANPKKTEFMVIGHQRRINEIDDLPPLELNDSKIKCVEKTKSLGVIIDGKDQYKSLTGKLAGGLSPLKNLKTFFPNQSYVMCITLSLKVIYATETLYGVASLHLNYKHFNVSKTEPYQL